MNKKGFTLIELLAVIIILGILMIIAIPSVTKYINDSRKNAYVDSAKEIIGSARNLVNSGSLEMYDTDATYYLDVKCINTENAMKSPYGEFVDMGAFVVVTYNGKGYDYYWTSVDDAGQGIKDIIKYDKLDIDNIESDLTIDDISTLRTIDGRGKVILITDRNGCKKEGPITQNLISVSSNAGSETTSNVVCKPATTLHTSVCTRTDSYGCNATGQVGNGNTITYGTLVSGSPKAGDAYDCDVNYDGVYDLANERFYYVVSEGVNSVLIYSKDMDNKTTHEYDSAWENNHGPRDGYQYLPSTSEWDNPEIIAPGTRQIVNENGETTTSGGNYTIESFTYEGKAARFLTVQELLTACSSISSVGGYTMGELGSCIWLMDGIGQYEGNTGTEGYWLETPRSTSNYRIWLVHGLGRYVHSYDCDETDKHTIRPVITINSSNLE